MLFRSHDRYFVERVCDNVYALDEDGGIRHLPGGVDQYLEQRRSVAEMQPSRPQARTAVSVGAALRAARKDVQRLERDLTRLGEQDAVLQEEMASHATDYTRLRELNARRAELASERERIEEAWLGASALLEA